MTLFDTLPPEEAARAGVRAVVVPKAAVGPGVAMFNWGTAIGAFARSPQKAMWEAQAFYHTNPWVRSAEATVTRRVVGLPWHLEDEQDQELDENSPQGKLVHDLLEAPMAALKPTGSYISWKDKPVPSSPKTWAGLTALTSRHMGLCGMAHWYLDKTDMQYGFPLALLYINPARMWAAQDEAGNLTGWVLDPKDDQGRGGTPLAVGEVLTFYLEPPDAGHYGIGLVEVACLKAQITNLADRHAAYILSTGGRLAGIVSPKEGSIPDDQFQALVREFRNLVEAPDAAKRTTILQGPVDFTPMAANPDDLELIDLSKMNRDDIFAIWGVPPSQAGVSGQGIGLNSGETRKYEEQILMQGAVHDRVVVIEQTIQYGLLDRLPTTIDLEIEEPTFNDDAPAYEMAASARELPLTNKERRALIGLDPFGSPEIDEAVWLPVGLTEAYPGGPTGPLAAPEPTPVPPALVPFARPTMPEPMIPEMAVKSRIGDAILHAHDRYVKRAEGTLQRAIDAFLSRQREEIAARVERSAGHLAKRPKDDSAWWDGEKWDRALLDILTPHYARAFGEVGKQVAAVFAGKADPTGDATLVRILKRAAKRVTRINETTRDAIRSAIEAGVDIGEGAAALGARIAQAAAFDTYRGELVARTETMFAWNGSAIESYRDVGVEMVEPQDGDKDEECAARLARGAVTLDEALGDEDHPNGTLSWVPVVDYAELRSIADELRSRGEIP